MSRLLLTFCAMLAAHGLAAAELIVGERPPEVTLQGDAGGRLDDSLWSSAALAGRVHLLMYVDPDESGLNAHVEQALVAKKYDQASVGSVGVINMAATWKPGFAIDMMLKKKQEKFPNTVYVRDKQKVFVERWGLTDNTYHVLAFGRDGQLLFSHGGALSDEHVDQLLQRVDAEIAR